MQSGPDLPLEHIWQIYLSGASHKTWSYQNPVASDILMHSWLVSWSCSCSERRALRYNKHKFVNTVDLIQLYFYVTYFLWKIWKYSDLPVQHLPNYCMQTQFYLSISTLRYLNFNKDIIMNSYLIFPPGFSPQPCLYYQLEKVPSFVSPIHKWPKWSWFLILFFTSNVNRGDEMVIKIPPNTLHCDSASFQLNFFRKIL